MERQYIIFRRMVDGSPRVVTVAAIDDIRGKLPYAITCNLGYKAQPNGLPVDGELTRVGGIEDKIIEALTPSGALHIGHVTGGGFMKVLLYGQEQPPPTLSIKTGFLKKSEVAVEARVDNEWSVYAANMEPNDLEYEEGRNMQLLKVLASHGDNATLPRVVDFAALFPSSAQRDAFVAEAAASGFTPSANPSWEDGDYWCELNKTTTIESDTIGRESSLLRKLAVKHGGTFDGWACPVTK